MNRLEKAREFARVSHYGQKRKLSGEDYILHPLEVEQILSTLTNDEDIKIAGLLHDTIEDCDVDPNTIEELFGLRVSLLVQAESEDRSSSKDKKDTWKDRKEESLMMLSLSNDKGVKMMWLADKLSNIRSIYKNYQVLHEELWSHFHESNPLMHKWYYQTVLDNLEELKDTQAYNEYKDLVNKVFRRYN